MRAASGPLHAAARLLTRKWPEHKGIPYQNHRLFMTGTPDEFKRWYERWQRLGCPASMRRERRRRRALLEHTPDEVRGESEDAEPGRDVVRIIGCGCGRHVCPRCGRRLGWKVRENVKRRLAELQAEHRTEGDVMMLTLTVDPKKFSGPRDAWESVRANRRVSRTMKSVGVTHYVAVIEFQKSGMPHWHILVWKPGVVFVGHRELEAAWRIGICRFTARNGRPMEWAVNYITKYLTKPEENPPEWVMQLHHVRSAWASREWGPVADGQHDVAEDDDALTSRESVGEIRTNGEAVADCASTCVMLLEHVSQDGELQRKFLGRVALHLRQMRRLFAGVTGARVRAMTVAVESAAWQRLRSAMPLVE